MQYWFLQYQSLRLRIFVVIRTEYDEIPFGNMSQVAACTTSSTPTLRCHIMDVAKAHFRLQLGIEPTALQRLQALCSVSFQCI